MVSRTLALIAVTVMVVTYLVAMELFRRRRCE